ncbi:MAG: methionine aminotransferase [Flavobacteriales bacterium]|nr:methionine aminotransferase [Flavobacteriales bacterium]
MRSKTPKVVSKLPDVGTTIFTVMSQLATKSGAINLSQGFPGFDIDPHLGELVHRAMKVGLNQYAPMPGIPALREVISSKHERLYGRKYDVQDEICVTSGATQALFTAFSAFIQPGDEVIVFTPAYDCYVPSIELNGGVAVSIELKAPHFEIPWEEVRERISDKTRMIVINNPHNPTGAVLQASDLEELAVLTRDTDILVLSDEVYEHITFDGQEHQSVARNEELSIRSIITYSFGKTFHATGWKMGYALAPASLMKEFRKVHQFNVFSANTPIQVALAKYMEDEDTYGKLPAFYQEKRDFFLDRLKDSRFTYLPAAGTYFQLLDYSAITQDHDVDVARRWTTESGIASIPISVFYPSGRDQHLLRFCFAKQEDELARAADILSGL